MRALLWRPDYNEQRILNLWKESFYGLTEVFLRLILHSGKWIKDKNQYIAKRMRNSFINESINILRCAISKWSDFVRIIRWLYIAAVHIKKKPIIRYSKCISIQITRFKINAEVKFNIKLCKNFLSQYYAAAFKLSLYTKVINSM